MSNSVWPFGLQPARLLCPWESREDTGAGCHFLLQGIFPDQGLNSMSPAMAGRLFTTEPPGRLLVEILPIYKLRHVDNCTNPCFKLNKQADGKRNVASDSKNGRHRCREAHLRSCRRVTFLSGDKKGPTSLWKVCCSKDVWACSLARGKCLVYDRCPPPGHWCVPGTNRMPNLSTGENTHSGVHTDTSVCVHFDELKRDKTCPPVRNQRVVK